MLFGVIDWVTWSIWLLGFIILVIWILVPIREFRDLYRAHKKGRSDATPAGSEPASGAGENK